MNTAVAVESETDVKLADPALLRMQGKIGAAWSDADDGTRAEVYNPATGSLVGTVPDMGAAETRRAIAAAAVALPEWSRRTAGNRATLLRKLHDEMLAHQEDLAILMTSEGGKPIGEARSEVAYSASFLDWFAEEGKRLYGDVVPGHQPDKRILVTREPVGVVATITPWNFPSAMLGRKLGAALAAGCTVVCKPALETPFSALAFAELADRVGIPAGVINIVTGRDGDAIGQEMTSNPVVRKLSFTGSTAVGKLLMARCADTMKRISLELGGNAPFIVFDDADLDAAVAGAIASKFRNSGQTCVCTNRFLVQDGIYDKFSAALVGAVKNLKVGDGRDEATGQGPLINKKAVEKVTAHVRDAEAKGGRLLCGGHPHALGHTFFEPTVIADATPKMQLAHEETFGPVAPLFRFSSEAEAIALANDTTSGLAAYFYTRDLARSWRMREALQYGIVGVNTGIVSTAVAPFGGIKESGVGSEGSKYGLLDYTVLKYTCIGGLQ
ncbi:MAG: succinate-semialdehyde dehydrogenase [Rhodanobacter sp.]|nr:MAG: succinate-semialdehyde dehydrogenase [Rhodanobacter sp.]TAL97032.1 MAG: succinate-semialdehyde dehydrogenase [Rhodanobacter sp.]TAM42428.1 MAG: succinate-semialdehyde dehydrogenase [Rhodanobacter sp.]